MNDINFSAGSSSLHLCADDTTQYIVHESLCTLETTLNQDIVRLTFWFTTNYLQVNATKTKEMALGKSQYPYNLFIDDKSIEIEPTLKILGVVLDRDLSLEPHVAIMVKKAYATIAVLQRIKRSVTSDVMISLYKAYVLPHSEYCCQLLLSISKALKNNIELANHHAIKTLLNPGNSATYDFCLAMAAMNTLEQRRTLKFFLILFFKCFKLDGPNYISQFFALRLTKYNLRCSGLNVEQPPYNSLIMHNSHLYMIAHM